MVFEYNVNSHMLDDLVTIQVDVDISFGNGRAKENEKDSEPKISSIDARYA